MSLATSASSGSAESFCMRRGIHSAKSLLSVLSTTNWYWVRLTAESMVMSCSGCMYRAMPTTFSVSVSSRRMISLAVA